MQFKFEVVIQTYNYTNLGNHHCTVMISTMFVDFKQSYNYSNLENFNNKSNRIRRVSIAMHACNHKSTNVDI